MCNDTSAGRTESKARTLRASRWNRESGFTLVELLVVIGIIAVLASLAVPLASRMRNKSRAMACASNVRQLMQGFLLFAAEHDRSLPGNFVDNANPDKDKRAWLLNDGQPVSAAPQSGTIYRYLGENKDVYRCFTLDTELANGDWGAKYGTNGRFDYAAIGIFTGAKLSWLDTTTRFTLPNGSFTEMPTPIIVEEDPRGGMSSSRWGEGLFNNTNRIASIHAGTGNYAALDGSVHAFAMPEGTNARNWSSITPKKNRVSLGTSGYENIYKWGAWGRF